VHPSASRSRRWQASGKPSDRVISTASVTPSGSRSIPHPELPARLASETVRGGLSILAADSLFIPAALVITGFLARRLGPSQYGLFVVTATIAGWLEWSLGALFARAAIRQVAAAADWRAPATTLLRVALTAGAAVCAALWLAAGPMAALMGEGALRPLLRLAAFNAPLFAVALAHRLVLTGLGRFGARAVTSAARSAGRLALVLILVAAGFGVPGAVAATMAGWAIELLVSRFFIRPRLTAPGGQPWSELMRLAAPLFIAGMSMRLFERLDVFCLQVLGGSSAETGTYGTAQTLAMLPGFIAASFAPALLSVLTRPVAAGEIDAARQLARQSLRCTIWLAPIAAAVAGASADVVQVVFGDLYPGAAPVLAILCVSSVAGVLIALSSTLLAAFDRAALSVAITAPLVPIAIVGHIEVIPLLGGVGAAALTSAVSSVVAVAGLLVVRRALGVAAGVASVARVALISAGSYALSVIIPGPGLLVVPKLVVITLLAAVGLVVSGEVAAADVAAAVWGRRNPAP
jgi:O-antigen/teichoic acid export membrane protein